jgi:lyso-ornithine lipid O-acyltransferase
MSRLLKAMIMAGVISVFLVGGCVLCVLFRSKSRRLSAQAQWTHHISRFALSVLGIRYWTEVFGENHIDPGTLLVANHVSYLDVLLISALTPSVFITSVEVRDSPFLGWIAKMAGSLFVERRNRMGIKDELAQVEETLRQGFNVVLFPEGTSSNGKAVLPFKGALLEAAISAAAPVRPLCLNYRYLNDDPVTQKEADILFYYGEMDFFTQLWAVLGIESSWAEIVCLSLLPVTQDSCRKTLCESIQLCIGAAHRTIPEGTETFFSDELAVAR